MKTKTAVEKKNKSIESIELKKNPCLFQINTRVWLGELSKEIGRHATLKDIPNHFLDSLKNQGFNWIYFLSVWQTGKFGQNVSRSQNAWIEGFRKDLSDLVQDDICGSGFAVTAYKLHSDFGDPEDLMHLQKRLHERGMKLMLDLVPNHTACDHPWSKLHPEYYIKGDENKLSRAPQNYINLDNKIFAYGRDPYFDGWPDTLQLNYANENLQKEMLNVVDCISQYCDGLRCDMAMLILPSVFKKTWGLDMKPFWPQAVARARSKKPDFVFMAEVYWDLEWELQQQGFSYTYDKKYYDRLKDGNANMVKEHLWADLSYQSRSARFLENHDEPRAAGVFFNQKHRAAAVLSFLAPGLRFFHQGQFEGCQKRVSVHVSRRQTEPLDLELNQFYDSLLNVLKLPVLHDGNWQLSTCRPAWDGNWTHNDFIVFKWTGKFDTSDILVVVNYSNHQSQSLVKFPLSENITAKVLEFRDLLNDETYPRERSDILDKGLFVDLKPWGYNVFAVKNLS